MIKSYILLVALLLMNGLVEAQIPQLLTMDEVVNQAIETSYDMKVADIQLKISEHNFAFFKTSLKPQIGLSVSLPDYINTSRGITQPNGSILFRPISQNNAALSLYGSQQISYTGGTVFVQSDLQRFDDFTSKYQSFNGIPLRVGIIQPIFGFNSIKWEQKINALSLGIAAKKINFDIENVKRTAASLFIDALLASSNLEIAITNEIINEKLVTIANERYLLGKLSMDEKLQLENALASAKLSKIQFTTQFQNRLMDLDNFLAKDYSQNDTVRLELPEPLPRLYVDEEQAVEHALANNFNLETFAQQLIQADRDIKKASVDNGLQMSLRASFGLARGSTTLSDIYQDPYGERQISVGVDIPIVNWGRKKEAVKIASLQKELVNTQISQSKAVIVNNVKRVVQAFNVLQDEVDIQKKIMENATQRFEISNQRYILGNIALTDLTIAQADKDRSKRDYVMSVARYWDAYYGIRMLTSFDFVTNQKIQN